MYLFIFASIDVVYMKLVMLSNNKESHGILFLEHLVEGIKDGPEKPLNDVWIQLWKPDRLQEVSRFNIKV